MLAEWRQIAINLYDQVVAAGQPDQVVRKALAAGHQEAGQDIRQDIRPESFSAILAVGKAALGMAQAAYAEGVRVAPDRALIIAPAHADSDAGTNPEAASDQHPWPVILSSHPVPDHQSLAAGVKAAALCQSLTADDHLLVLLSGGASALMVNPNPPLTLADKVLLNERLLASGGDIHQINAIRRLVSQIKGGRLAAMAHPAQITQFIISDVEDDELASIGSGIMAGDPVPLSDSLALIKTLGLADYPFMEAFIAHLKGGKLQPPLSPDEAVFDHVKSHILASNRQVVHAGLITSNNMKTATALPPDIIELPRLSGEASHMASHLATLIKSSISSSGGSSGGSSGRPVIGITGGETVVSLPSDHGLGGRSQELALAFALAMQDADIPWLILAAGTDGRDGPTDAAGAILDSQMELDILAAQTALLRHDVWNLLNRCGGLFRPGSSGTNLADLVVIMAG